MPNPRKLFAITICLILLVGAEIPFAQSMQPEKTMWDFDVVLTPNNLHIAINSDNLQSFTIINITIYNTGYMPDKYTVDASCSLGWPMVIPQTNPPEVPPNSAVVITASIVIPQATRPTLGEITATVQSMGSPSQLAKTQHAPIDFRRPMISVSSISITPSDITAGKDATIETIMKNSGNYYEPRTNISIYDNGKPIALNVSVGKLDPGEVRSIKTKWTAVQGSHKIMARTDNWFADDENNTISQTIDVKAASLTGNFKFDIGLYSFIVILFVIVIIFVVKRRKMKKSKLSNLEESG